VHGPHGPAPARPSSEFSAAEDPKPADAATAMAAVLKAAAEGELTPMEVGEVARLLDLPTISSAAAAK